MHRNFLFKMTIGFSLLFLTTLGLSGCGGGGSDSYTDLDAEYNSTDTQLTASGELNSLIQPETLRAWDANAGVLDDGLYETDQGERVILIDAIDTPANKDLYYLQGHIPGSIVNYSHEGVAPTTMDRNDGPFLEPHDVPDGASMDKAIQNLGITKDAVIVITTVKKNYDFCASRLFYTFRYWGFSRHNIKVLDRGLNGWEDVGGMVSTAPPANPQPSTMSVTDLPGPKSEVRTTIGQLLSLIDNGKIDGLDGEVILLDARPPNSEFTMGTADPADDVAFAFASRAGMAFDGYPRGATIVPSNPATSPIAIPNLITTSTGDYADPAAIKAAFDAAGIDGSKPIIVYCNSAASASRYFFVISEILGYEVSEFDGSMLTWTQMAAYQPGDLTYVRHDATFLSATMITKKNPEPDSETMFFQWDPATEQFVDYLTGDPVPAGSIVPGGNLAGNDTWDTIKRFEFVAFRPTVTVNDAANGQTYDAYDAVNETTLPDGVTVIGSSPFNGDWAPVVAYPSYEGPGTEALDDDSFYEGPDASNSGSAPTSSASGGGGC